MRSLFFCIFVLGNVIAYGQRSSQDTTIFRGNRVGVEVTAFEEEYGALRLSYMFGFTKADLLDLDLSYVNDEDEGTLVTGFTSTLQYKKILLANSFYLGTGAKYMSTNLNTDIVLNRLNNAFFQEFEVNQKRKAVFGVISLGGLLNFSDTGAAIDFEYQLHFGKATYSLIPGTPPNAELVNNSTLDDRLVYTTISDHTENFRGTMNFNITFSFKM